MSRKNCCVAGCNNTYENTKARGKLVSFYRFPSENILWNIEKRFHWINAVKRMNRDGSMWHPAKNSRICSDHFVGGSKSENPNHPAYTPTIFPPVKTERSLSLSRYDRANVRSNKRLRSYCVKSTYDTSSNVSESESNKISYHSVSCQADLYYSIDENYFMCNTYQEASGKCTSSVQVCLAKKVDKAINCELVCGENIKVEMKLEYSDTNLTPLLEY